MAGRQRTAGVHRTHDPRRPGAVLGYRGDPDPIGFGGRLTRMAGLDTVVSQAMPTMAPAGAHVTALVGDPAAVRGFRATFTSPVFVHPDRPDEVTCGARVTDLDLAARRGELAITATHLGTLVFDRCSAFVDLRQRPVREPRRSADQIELSRPGRRSCCPGRTSATR
ncbi:hypothetical protein GYA93_10625 [Gordonia desulfuricans]|uniref:Thioesterase family protein n=1 Tax=Gordonia desulfuricans TaxID=89051 RepID=A0A7K3LP58_9ACTN|nr:hypothetical protein [Gordonia desulfuricans]